jgi:PEP-CTERM motif
MGEAASEATSTARGFHVREKAGRCGGPGAGGAGLATWRRGAAAGGAITYTIDDYPALQIGFITGQPVHISGSITTNGTLGTNLNAASIITDYTVTFSQGSTSDTFTFGGPGQFSGIIDVTNQAITLAAGNGNLILASASGDLNVDWDPRRATEKYANFDQNHGLVLEWATNTTAFASPTFLPIAEAKAVPVPEPSSLALLSLGGLALAAWRRWKKRATA